MERLPEREEDLPPQLRLPRPYVGREHETPAPPPRLRDTAAGRWFVGEGDDFVRFWWNHGFKLFVLTCLVGLWLRGCHHDDRHASRLDDLEYSAFGTTDSRERLENGQLLPFKWNLPADSDGAGISTASAEFVIGVGPGHRIGPFAVGYGRYPEGHSQARVYFLSSKADTAAAQQLQVTRLAYSDAIGTVRAARFKIERTDIVGGAPLSMPEQAGGNIAAMLTDIYPGSPRADEGFAWVKARLTQKGPHEESFCDDIWELTVRDTSIEFVIRDN